MLTYPKMSEELLAEVNKILGKEISDEEMKLYRAVINTIAEELVDSKYWPWLLAHKMTADGCKVLLALPDEDWLPEYGEKGVSDKFVERVQKEHGLSTEFIRQQVEDSYYNGDVFSLGKKGPHVTDSRGHWIDLQNSKRWYERNGEGFYKIIGLMVEEEFSPLQEKAASDRWKLGKGSVCRIVPKYDTVKDIPGLLPAENYLEMLKSREVLSQNQCACRIRHMEYEQDCGVCLSANRLAKYAIDMELGEEISWEDAMEYLRKASKKEVFFGIQKNSDSLDTLGDVFCNCTPNACAVVRHTAVTGGKHKVWDYYNKSRFRAEIDIDKCIHCNICVKKRCLFEAIQMKYYRNLGREDIYVNEDQCMGCGCCVETCPTGALKMKLVDPPEALLGYAKDYDGNYIKPDDVPVEGQGGIPKLKKTFLD